METSLPVLINPMPAVDELVDDADFKVLWRLRNQIPASPASSVGDDADLEAFMGDYTTDISESEGEGQDEGQDEGQGEDGRISTRTRRPVAPHIRQRKQKDPIQYGELDFSKLWDVGDALRAHPPIPEIWCDSYRDCVRFYQRFARENGIALNRHRWIKNTLNTRYKCEIRCMKGGRRKDIKERQRPGSQSLKTGCPYSFYIVAEDYKDPMNSRWRILHMTGQKNAQKSIQHNHPPFRNVYVVPRYRREWRTEEVREKIRSLFPTSSGAKEVLIRLRQDFPGLQMTRQDVRNEYRLFESEGFS